MRLTYVPALAAVTMLAACSQASKEPASEEAAPENHFGFAEATSYSAAKPERLASVDLAETTMDRDSAGPGKLDPGNGTPPSDVDVGHPPQIAYVFDYGFRLAAKAIAPLQQRHADLCESKGPYVCRIVQMDQSSTEGDYVRGTLQLAVRSDQARAFGKELTKAAEQVEGEQISATISGEDLSKQIVDTDARLRVCPAVKSADIYFHKTLARYLKDVKKLKKDVYKIISSRLIISRMPSKKTASKPH